MAGINLSQSSQKKQVNGRALVDRGFVIVILLSLAVLAAWGGLRFYMYTVDKSIASLQANIENSNDGLTGEKVDRVVDIHTRLTHISEGNEESVDIPALVSQLEKLTVPEVRLTEYRYDAVAKMIKISGTTSNFRFVAQQLIGFRSESPLQDIQVEKIGNVDEGQIPFTLKAAISQ